jgi:pimeloyl-ACP methyl ester carboxylesterase
MAMKTFLLSPILATAFTFIVSVAAAGPCGDSSNCDVEWTQTDFTEDLKKITVPVLVMHSEDDQIVPYVAAGPLSAKLLRNGTLKTYKDLPHGMPTTHAEMVNAELLAFFKG